MITQDFLKSILKYNHETGLFTWVVRPSNAIQNGSQAGSIDKNHGYECVVINGRKYKSQTLAFLYIHGVFALNIDHINGVKHDNRISNLRISTISENCMNRKIASNNKTGVKGVNWNKIRSSYCARICADGKSIHVGWFKNLDDARVAIIKARIENHGKFANHG